MMNGLEDVDDDVLEGVDNLNIDVGVRCKFYMCCRRHCKCKPRPSVRSVSQSNLFFHWSSSRLSGFLLFVS